ncbi:hypothetical protein ACTL32_13440 [Planococcus sp. FY231025]|uniref:hypothetical protein n=1 Tax=Planococcus sp. FY231025 TaxID=3455699 RepID=UPI003F8F4B6D
MNLLSLAIGISFLGVIIFGALSFIELYKICKFMWNMKKNEKVLQEEWFRLSQKAVFYNLFFFIVGAVFRILKGI